jgi:NADH-quinone oxidoreductase subunit L
MSTTTYGWLVLACPIAGTILIGFGYARWPGRSAGWIATLAIALSFVFSVLAFIKLQGLSPDHRQVTSSLWDYDVSAGVDAKLQILIDPLSIFMMLVVSGVSTLIHLYSVSYMTLDKGFSRFFSYLNYFVFSMLLLVEAGNFIILIVGWAFVGAASYLLISFWYRRTTATRAGIKAFVINVVGDVGLVIATFIIFQHTGTLQFLPVFHAVPHDFAHNGAPIVVACLLLLVGAFAKSAQVPLHTWLPDAMEGPTPVSALIHAATMVTAGVYLIARMHVLFEWGPTAADVGAIGGCLTLVLAATVALVMTDIKRVIAYSTMSQIGYMIMGVCVGAYSAGLFHLMTHAFFKALLFMAAGSIIGAMAGDQSLDHMSGFRKALPFTFICFLVGGLALSGMPPFSGWLSKDDIIGFLDHRGGGFEVLGIIGYLGAFMTGLYTFRMIFRAFFNEPCEEARELEHGHLHHAEVPRNPMTGEEEDTDVGFPGPGHFIAEREWPMKIAMSALAVLAVIGGLVQVPGIDDAVTRFLEPTFADSKYVHVEVATGPAWLGLIIGALIAIAGISIAGWIWIRQPGTSTRLRERFSGAYVFLSNKWYFDEIIDFAIVRPTLWLGRVVTTTFERGVITGVITDGTTSVVRAGSAAVRRAQTGFLRYYAALMIVCLSGVALYFLLSSS